MIKLKKIGSGLVLVVLAVGASLLVQSYADIYAANTLVGSNNEVIRIGGTTDGLQVNAAVVFEGVSADGNIILFTSAATNLPNAGGYGGVYVYNIKTSTVARVDVSTAGVQPNFGNVGPYKLSETGRFVTFMSSATNLIDGQTSPMRMIYKRDTQTGVTSWISDGNASGSGQNWDRNLAISNDGRFALLASRYIANGYPYPYGVVVGDSAGGVYAWTSLGKGSDIEGSNNGTAMVGGMSCDGSFVVHQVNSQVELADLRRGTITKIVAGNNTSTAPMISCNGRYILYATQNRTDIAPTPVGMNANLHLVRYDRVTGGRMYIDSNSSGVFSTSYAYNYMSSAPSNVFSASIADTGDVVFQYNGYVYLKHLSDGSGTLESVARHASGASVNVANGSITSDGRYIFFNADPYNLGLAGSASTSKIIRTKTGI